MHRIAELVVEWVVMTGLTFAILLLDERWMSEDSRERAWPPVSRDAAVIAFGPFVLLVHFLRTRGGFTSLRRVFLGLPLGFVMGAAALFVVSVVGTLLVNLVMMLLGYPVDWSLE